MVLPWNHHGTTPPGNQAFPPFAANSMACFAIAEIRVEERIFLTKHGTEAKRKVTTSSTGDQIPMMEKVLRGLPDDVLMAEVRRRGLVEGLSNE